MRIGVPGTPTPFAASSTMPAASSAASTSPSAASARQTWKSTAASGFENHFRELAPLLAAADRDETAIGEVVARHDLDIDFGTIPILAERHGLRLA